MFEIDGSKLKTLRKEMGLTQGELGRKVGRKAEHICHYEKNRANPPFDVLLQMMSIFNVSAEAISREKQNN